MSGLQVLSLGAGVQSTTMALMVKHGDLPPVDCAIFADTGWEPRPVYEHLTRLKELLSFPIFIVRAGNLRSDTLARSNTTGGRFAAIPWFTSTGGMGRRQCTKEYKLRPIQRKVRELLGGKTLRDGCTMLIGISWDEAFRRKPSQVRYIINRFPLLEKQMTRRDCLRWLEERQYSVPPKSSCIGCPYHSDEQWREIRSDAGAWADAIEVDRAIRHQPKMKALQYMHRSLKPLDEVDLSTAEERGQLNLFINECEGMCGV